MTATTATAKVMLMTFFLSMIQMFLDFGRRVVRRCVSRGFLGAELVAVEIDQQGEKDNADNADDDRCGNFVHRYVCFAGLKKRCKDMGFAGNGFRLLPTFADFCRFLPTFYCKFAVNFVYSEKKHYLCRRNVNLSRLWQRQ